MIDLTCKRCSRAVTTDPGLALDVFEGMHWLCFHLEFEHTGDPDLPCGDPSCYQAADPRSSLVPSAPEALASEAERATSLLGGKTVARIWRHSPRQVVVQFTDGIRLHVDRERNGVGLSIT